FSTDGTTHRCGKVDSHQPPMSLVPMWESTSLREIPAADASSESLEVTARVSCLSFRCLSIAFDTSKLFGIPDPYTQPNVSLISNPANRIDRPIKSCVRAPAKTAICPPGFSTRIHSPH